MATKPKAKIRVDLTDEAHVFLEDTAFIRHLQENKQAAQTYKGALQTRSKMSRLNWRGDVAVPRGSAAWEILEAFRFNTDLPLDLAWHSLLFRMSTYCIANGVTVECGGQVLKPALWTIVLAPSGSGKTYSLARIKAAKMPQAEATITGFESGAKLVEMMMENELAGLPNAMLIDEVGQKFKGVETEGHPLASAKEVLLNASMGEEVSRKTRRDELIVKDSTCTFLGLNVDETFIKILSAESLVDGFAQRFAYVIADRDIERMFYEFPIYDNKAIEKICEIQQQRIWNLQLHENYVYSEEALETYKREFTQIGKMIHESEEINVSFFRRLMQRTHSLALMMHLLFEDESNVISKRDVEQAMMQTRLHITDAAELIARKSPNTNTLMENVDKVAQRLISKGQPVTGRTLGQHVYALKGDTEKATMVAEAWCNMNGVPYKRRKTPTKKAA